VLPLLLRGKVLPPTFFKLVRVVKLWLQIGIVSRETQNGVTKDLHVSGRPYEGARQCLNPVFFLAGLCLPHTPLPAQPGMIHVKKRVPGYSPADARGLTRIVVEAIVFLICPRVYRRV